MSHDGIVYVKQGWVSSEGEIPTDDAQWPGKITFEGPWVHVESADDPGQFWSFPAAEVTRVRWTKETWSQE